MKKRSAKEQWLTDYRLSGPLYPVTVGQEPVSPEMQRKTDIAWMKFLESLKAKGQLNHLDDIKLLNELHQKYPEVK
ncbi:hypothetical protein ACFQ22_13080 [Lentilactobacillus raoultii]|uniref:Uncharacterized protein n=1 Tax=Lentilactobacillus raoultii TaxID=1987503 RepID=A0ABW3PPP8_9LACO|nr:hypothetical protein [Lentilactobacillus raoultii]